MLEKIVALRNGENSVNEFLSALRQGIPSAVFGVSDAFKNYMVSTVESPVLYVVKDFLAAATAERAIRELTGKKTVYLPEKEETLILTRAFSKDGLYKRIRAIKDIKSADVIITTAAALMQPCPKAVRTFTVSRGQTLSREEIISFLTETGYERTESVEVKGTFAVRGDVLDVFPIDAEEPLRIDFFDDYVENIKTFDTETRKTAAVSERAEIIQAKEYVFNAGELQKLLKTAKEETLAADKTRKIRLKEIYEDILLSAEKEDEGLNALAVLSLNCGTVFDLLAKDTVVIFDEAKRVYDSAVLSAAEFTERFNSLYSAGEVFSFAKKNCIGTEELKNGLMSFREATLQTLSAANPFFNPLKIVNPKSGGVINYRLDFKEVFTDIDNWLYSGYRVLICAGNASRAEMLCRDLSDRGIASAMSERGELKGVVISTETLSAGFIFHEEKVAVIGSGNLFSRGAPAEKLKVRRQSFFTAPEVGDYCVHEIHGIGRVLGVKKITTTEGTKDYVAVEYQGGDVLYVPVEQMDILTRYLGSEKKPKLSRIGGVDFEKV
ncbi:MAG: hypothetical protein J6Y43_07695, partial [Clostridia bacterium]|nr:hypothetical protein [Clostridia bacterium]